MKSKKVLPNHCPICGCKYQKSTSFYIPNLRNKHHLFPRLYYGPYGIKLSICSKCHTEFHRMFPMYKRIWLRSECLTYWVKFCKSKGKDAFEIYPELTKLESML